MNIEDIKFYFPETPGELIYEFNRRMKSDEYPDKSSIWIWFDSEANILQNKGYSSFNFLYPNSICSLEELYKTLFGKDYSKHIKSNKELIGEIFMKSIKENRKLTEDEHKELERLYAA